MTDLPTLAAALMANFVTIHVPRCEQVWTWPRPAPSLERRPQFIADAAKCERLNASCQRQHFRWLLWEAGHGAFLDHVELDGVFTVGAEDVFQINTDGLKGWRMRFFCLDPAAMPVLKSSGVGECGRGDPIALIAEKFVMRHLRKLAEARVLDQPDRWSVCLD